MVGQGIRVNGRIATVIGVLGPGFDLTSLDVAVAQFVDQLAAVRVQLFGWLAGLGLYPLALGLMVVSAILPLLYFRRRGWL